MEPRTRSRVVAAAALTITLAACASAPAPVETGSGSVPANAVRYVAIGDSYTIGTSVSEAESWPTQLAERVDGLELVANVAVNGYTTEDVLTAQIPQLADLNPDFVTVLVGVNDVVRGVDADSYAIRLDQVLGEAQDHVASFRILCVATPDYTVTPRGADFGDPVQQSAAIRAINAAMQRVCEARGIAYVGETFEISRRAADDPSLVASDGLHPSGAQYTLWTDAIEPVVRELLGASLGD